MTRRNPYLRQLSAIILNIRRGRPKPKIKRIDPQLQLENFKRRLGGFELLVQQSSRESKFKERRAVRRLA